MVSITYREEEVGRVVADMTAYLQLTVEDVVSELDLVLALLHLERSLDARRQFLERRRIRKERHTVP